MGTQLNDYDEFFLLFNILYESGCEKKQVAAGTYVNGVFKYATNTCTHEGLECPRLNLPSGVGWELCKTHHAEIGLVELLGEDKSDGIVWIAGHYWCCEPCASALKSIGVKEIRVREKP